MHVSERFSFTDLVQSRIDQFIDERTSIFLSITPELTPLSKLSKEFLSGGKKFRALFCFWGWQSINLTETQREPALQNTLDINYQAIIDLAASQEIFHAAALIHDDIIDRSHMRRSRPSIHRQFEELHQEKKWVKNSEFFGQSCATLLGDFLLVLSDELFDQGFDTLTHLPARKTLRAEYSNMKREVIAGQFLDLFEEVGWSTFPEDTAIQRAENVMLCKSAKYSIATPLILGAQLAGAYNTQLESLRAFGLPLGMAYQLRDDLLGVFGDPTITGKPCGDDLREGKRTLLIALTRQKLISGTLAIFDELLTSPDMTDDQILMLQNTITDSGSVQEVEKMIKEYLLQAKSALSQSPFTADVCKHLNNLAQAVTNRTS